MNLAYSDIFPFSTNIIILLTAIYLVPILNFFLHPIKIKNRFLFKFNCLTGKFEHAVAWFRIWIANAYLMAGAFFYLYALISAGQTAVSAEEIRSYFIITLSLLLVTLSFVHQRRKLSNRRRLIRFASKNPKVHPNEFFSYLFAAAGVMGQNFPREALRTIDPKHLNFKGKHRWHIARHFINVFNGVFSTIWCTKLAHMALKWKGRDFFREVCAGLAVIWGVKMIELTSSELIIEDLEDLSVVSGYNIFFLNHMSFLDFAVVPVLLAAVEEKTTADTLPRFLVAKDNFLDNPIFHRVLGLGRVARDAGMIFVDRRGDKLKAKESIDEAVAKLISDGREIAIFPQGTRARGRCDAKGERIDAAYYAVGRKRRIKRDGDHLKKGAAFLGLDAALALMEKGVESNVNLMPVAIKGTSIIAPKGSVIIKPNTTIRLSAAKPIIINRDRIRKIKKGDRAYFDLVSAIHKEMDDILKDALSVHGDLERRFFEDMRSSLTPPEIEEMAVAMKQWRGGDYLVFAILDCIYTCKPKHWYPLLGRLIYLIRSDAPRKELLNFKGEVVEYIDAKK